MKQVLPLIALLITSIGYAQKPRAKELGIPFVVETDKFNAITTTSTWLAIPHDKLIEILKKYNHIKK
ncbi:hypothetical protein [Allomuricauda sp. M10]|uniref:hypothetical protein n=1 Tax=Allomuricauda sp. M10 TaxID=2683292 RepID=UPI001D1910B0|nr:hypothetical protein [Muricauda sp. M10]